MANDLGLYIASGLAGFGKGYVNGREKRLQREQEQKKLDEQSLQNIAKNFQEGTSVDPVTKKPSFTEGYLDPNSDVYKGFSRTSELKRLSSPSGVAHETNEDLSPLATSPTAQKYGFTADYLKSLPKGGTVGKLFELDARPQTPGNALASDAQRKEYAAIMGVPFETTENLTTGQLHPGIRYVRGQEAAGERQAGVFRHSDDQLAKRLEQSGSQFDERMDFDKAKDLQNRVEKFRDDYAKTGIPTMLPKFERLDKLTGVLSADKPDMKRLPGYGTNALRSLPLIGQGAAALAAKKYGGAEEAQIIQDLINADIRQLSGQAVTRYEEGRNMFARGLGAGGNEQDVVRGIRAMYDAVQGADRDVRAGYPAEVTDTYAARGGNAKVNPSNERARSAKKLGIKESDLAKIDQYSDKSAPPSGPKNGDVVDGYRFKGGKLSDKKSWEKVK